MEINRNNYEFWFLLYLDGELEQTDKELVEKFLSENVDLQKEFSIFSGLRFVSADIQYDNKKDLLRTGEKRRIVPLYWMRIAAITLTGIAGVWLIMKNRTDQQYLKNIAVSAPKVENKVVREPVAMVKSNLEVVAVQEKKVTTSTRKKPQVENIVNEKTETNSTDIQEYLPEVKKSYVHVTPVTYELSVDNEKRQLLVGDSKISTTASLPVTVASKQPTVKNIPPAQSDQSEDVSISFVSLNTNNKSGSGFFKKLLKNSGIGNSGKSDRTVNVSVLQISY